jgi:hypothetical protein
MLFLRTDKYIGASLDLYGEYSHRESELFAQLVAQGQIVIEVGTNSGAHTVPLARLVGETGQVLAFEPQRGVHELLCGNPALNELFNSGRILGRAAHRVTACRGGARSGKSARHAVRIPA